jgi:hypothetical protein
MNNKQQAPLEQLEQYTYPAIISRGAQDDLLSSGNVSLYKDAHMRLFPYQYRSCIAVVPGEYSSNEAAESAM